MNYRIRNKWIVVVGAMSSQLAIGALYAWSLFNKPISEAFGVEIITVYRTYTIALAAFALTMILSGKLQLSLGARRTSLIGGILYSGGVLLSSFATTPLMLYVTYGLITGAGVAFVYVCQLATLVKWFPNRKGAITGLATAGFALGGFTFKQVLTRMFDVPTYTPEIVSGVFLTLGIIFAVMTIGGALLLDVPEDHHPAAKVKDTGKNFTRLEMLKTGNFYKLLFSDMLALMPGLLVIGLAKDIGTQFVGLDYITASWVVGFIALINAAGRLASGVLADKLGALNVYRAMYIVTIASLAVLAFVDLSYPIFLVAIMGIAIGYGSFLSLVPTIVGRLFGGKYFSANYAFIFQAYGIAALLGPSIKAGKTFDQTFMIAMGTAIVGFIIAMMIKDVKEEKVVTAKETILRRA